MPSYASFWVAWVTFSSRTISIRILITKIDFERIFVMRLFFILFLSQTIFTTGHCALKLELKHSEAASYLHFLNTGFGEPFTSGSLKEIIENSKTSLFQDEILRNNFKLFKSFTEHGYNFSDEITNRPEGFWGEDALTSLAITAPDLKTFEKQLSIFMPYRGLTAYFKIKEKIYPLFNKLLWKPSLSSQNQQIKMNEDLIKKSHFIELLQKAKNFYSSDYPETLPFKVGLVPIPDKNIKSTHTSAENLKDVQVVPYLISRGLKDNLDVIFHEFCHALYEGQSLEIQKEIDNFYLNQDNPYAIFVYRYLNEALATAWGNGWYYESLHGVVSAKSWYTVSYIDGLAKAFLPLIKSYVNAAKPLDKEFMLKTLKLAKNSYPTGPREVDTNFISLRLTIDVEKITSQNLKKILKSNFRINSLYTSSESDTQCLPLSWNNSVGNFLLITTKKENGLSYLKQLTDFSEIKSRVKYLDNFAITIPYQSKYVIWINIENEKKFSDILTLIKDKAIFSESIEVLNTK